jgi:hypothetical protein
MTQHVGMPSVETARAVRRPGHEAPVAPAGGVQTPQLRTLPVSRCTKSERG